MNAFQAAVSSVVGGLGVVPMILLAAVVLLGLRIIPALLTLFAGVRDAAALDIEETVLPQKFRLATSHSDTGDAAIPPGTAQYRDWVHAGDWPSLHRQLLCDDASRAQDVYGQRLANTGVTAAMEVLHDANEPGGPGAPARVAEAVDAFDARFRANPSDLAAAVLAAQAHMELGWMHRGGGTIDTVSEAAFAEMQEHFEIAGDILRPFEVATRGSPLLAAANFRLAVGTCDDVAVFHAARAIWSSLDPGDPEMMANVAFHMLPRWYGSHAALHRAAEEIAARNPQAEADRAYATVILSVAHCEPMVVRAADADRIARGAEAMIRAAGQDQQVVNQVAAGLYELMFAAHGARRKVLRGALRQLLETELRTFMLDLWPDEFAETRWALANLFSDELNAGGQISIDAEGFRLSMPQAA